MGWFWWFPASQIATVLPILGWALVALTVLIVTILGVAHVAVWLLFRLIDAVIGLLPHKPQAPSDTSSQS